MAILKPLTRNQLAVFSFCREWLDDKQSFPSIRVIASAFGFESQNAASCYIKALVKKGYLQRWEHKYNDTVRNKTSITSGYRITSKARNVSFQKIFTEN